MLHVLCAPGLKYCRPFYLQFQSCLKQEGPEKAARARPLPCQGGSPEKVSDDSEESGGSSEEEVEEESGDDSEGSDEEDSEGSVVEEEESDFVTMMRRRYPLRKTQIANWSEEMGVRLHVSTVVNSDASLICQFNEGRGDFQKVLNSPKPGYHPGAECTTSTAKHCTFFTRVTYVSRLMTQ